MIVEVVKGQVARDRQARDGMLTAASAAKALAVEKIGCEAKLVLSVDYDTFLDSYTVLIEEPTPREAAHVDDAFQLDVMAQASVEGVYQWIKADPLGMEWSPPTGERAGIHFRPFSPFKGQAFMSGREVGEEMAAIFNRTVGDPPPTGEPVENRIYGRCEDEEDGA